MERAIGVPRRLGAGGLAALAAALLLAGCGSGGGSPAGVTSAASGSPAAGSGGEAAARTVPSTARLVGERLIVGLSETAIPTQLRSAIRRGRVAGVVLYADNFPTRAAGRRLIASLQSIPRPPGRRQPLLILVDQEGGLVKRVDGAPSASGRQMGERGGAFSRVQGRRTGENLRQLGVNVDIAPVLDVGRPGSEVVAGDRAFAATAAGVTRTAVPFAEGLQAAGVAATAKHFPGIGAASEDTDVEVGSIGLSKARLRAVDERPYAAYARGGGDMVMVSTSIYPAFSSLPAAFSAAIVKGELRRRIGFEGVAMTDALDTVAVTAFGTPAQAALAAARAGCDLLLFTELEPAEAGFRALAAALRSGRLDRAAFEASAQRVLDLRARLGNRVVP